jgi:hypothetical protein
MATLDDILGAISRSNQLLEAILAKVSQILSVISSQPNGPPVYTGPTSFAATVGVPFQLEGSDPDGDVIIWGAGPGQEAVATVNTAGQLVMLVPSQKDANGNPIPIQVTVTLDDGKP